MNRFLIPVLIFIGSLIYSWFWNCYRKPLCLDGTYENTIVLPSESSPDTVEIMVDDLIFEPLTIQFGTAESSISTNQAIDNFISSTKMYLEINPNKKISIVGHTDNDGTHITNDRLAIKRANLVRDLLLSNGFVESNMQISGEGKRSPVSSNDTPEGMARNRRVEINLLD